MSSTNIVHLLFRLYVRLKKNLTSRVCSILGNRLFGMLHRDSAVVVNLRTSLREKQIPQLGANILKLNNEIFNMSKKFDVRMQLQMFTLNPVTK